MKLGATLAVCALLVSAPACKNSSSSSGGGNPKIGDTVTFDDSEWVVIEAKDVGRVLKSNSEFNDEQKKTNGRFIQVHFKVTNKDKKEQIVMDAPKIVDDKGGEYPAIQGESSFVPAKTKSIGLQTLNPSTPAEFWTVIEVTPNAKNLKLEVHGFSLLNEKKDIELGL